MQFSSVRFKRIPRLVHPYICTHHGIVYVFYVKRDCVIRYNSNISWFIDLYKEVAFLSNKGIVGLFFCNISDCIIFSLRVCSMTLCLCIENAQNITFITLGMLGMLLTKHCLCNALQKRLAIFPFPAPAWMSLIKLSQVGNNEIILRQGKFG
jgi:hypothetical protein